MRLIDADALRINAMQVTETNGVSFNNCFPYWQFSKCIKEAPTIEAAPVIHTEWITNSNYPDKLNRRAKMIRETILDTAKQCICTDREAEYGTPQENLGRIAALWSGYAAHDFTAHDVAIMMALVKVGRIASGKVKQDTYVDIAGYAALAGELA